MTCAQIYEICQELLRFWENEITDEQDYDLVVAPIEEIIAELPILPRA